MSVHRSHRECGPDLVVRVVAIELVVGGRLGVALVVAVHGASTVSTDERASRSAVCRLAIVLHVLGVGLRSVSCDALTLPQCPD